MDKNTLKKIPNMELAQQLCHLRVEAYINKTDEDYDRLWEVKNELKEKTNRI